MKGVGLDDPRTGRWPYAVVQLRQDNALGTLWNMVGFQTKMKHGEQVRIFRTIPGLESAEFARLGGIHRNSFIRSPALLDGELRLKSKPNIRFAGQITGWSKAPPSVSSPPASPRRNYPAGPCRRRR
jgi:methylenetetrahydrofolate--tRNA-(uracil-5-)-methyltransferase